MTRPINLPPITTSSDSENSELELALDNCLAYYKSSRLIDFQNCFTEVCSLIQQYQSESLSVYILKKIYLVMALNFFVEKNYEETVDSLVSYISLVLKEVESIIEATEIDDDREELELISVVNKIVFEECIDINQFAPDSEEDVDHPNFSSLVIRAYEERKEQDNVSFSNMPHPDIKTYINGINTRSIGERQNPIVQFYDRRSGDIFHVEIVSNPSVFKINGDGVYGRLSSYSLNSDYLLQEFRNTPFRVQRRKNHWMGLLGSSAAFLATGLVLEASARHTLSRVNNEKIPYEEVDEKFASAQVQNGIGLGLGALGLAGVTVSGIFTYRLDQSKRQQERSEFRESELDY